MPYKDKAKQREYQKQYHIENWSHRKIKHQELKRTRRIVLANWLKNYKQKLFCIKCSENHPACLDFHHTNGDDKSATIANMISEGYAINTILKAISKCIVLCKNCHAKEHFSRL